MRLTQDDCPSISVSRLRALGEVTEDMGSVRVEIAGVSRKVRLSHMRFPNGGGWSFFICPSCGREARVLKLLEKIACWRCTRSGSPSRPLRYRIQQGDKVKSRSVFLARGRNLVGAIFDLANRWSETCTSEVRCR
jgi:hypothetical protein